MNKLKILLIIFICIFLLTGCELANYKAHNTLTEEEIIDYVEKEIYTSTNDKVSVKIVSKEQKRMCIIPFSDSTCIYHENVENGYEYKLEITSLENSEIVATGTYIDGYIEYDSEHTNIIDPVFESNYLEQKKVYLDKNN